GTVTVLAGGGAYEMTTLREDILTDGRHAVVRFGRDWEADARRRDFTMNALSVDAAGRVHDPVGGYADIVARRVRFIGDPAMRIAEDRLRVLRFFRLHAWYGAGDLDPAGLAASIAARDGLRALSAERIGQEMCRLVVAPRAVETVAAMDAAGILAVVLDGAADPAAFARLVGFEAAAGLAAAVAVRLAALACRSEADVTRIAGRLRLANAERRRMAAAVAAAVQLADPPGPRAARALVYRPGPEAFIDGVALAVAAGRFPARTGVDLVRLAEGWPPPRFPLAGRDVVAAGVPAGPAVGAVLAELERWWVEGDFAADEAALRARLQQMAAAAQ
ncbi:MAG TPA: CCA tRNA nucleotidyltransferase, partial [Bauldia sp.]|nr:CCA tRNA nucleotidyltransferase [Bauldia sp.]